MKITNEDLIQQWGRIFLLVHRQLDRAMTAEGASLARTKLLLYIERLDGKAKAAGIAELFGQAPRTVTEALDALERDGLIARTKDAEDRRIKRIAITAEGRRAIAATEPVRRALIGELCATLTDEDREDMVRCFGKLAAALGPEVCGEISLSCPPCDSP